MPTPVPRRDFDAFLSHAHVDRAFVAQIYDWLTRVAGLEIWYDAKEMAGGTGIARGLNSAIEKCRGLIVVGSEDALKSGWVEKELNVAQDEQTRSKEFRFVPIIVGDADPGSMLRGVSLIRASRPELDFNLAIEILRALHPPGGQPNPRRSRDVYVSASWHSDDNTSAVAVCKKLASEGFRMVGDSKDQDGFKGDRLHQIMSSCGAFVSIIPHRGAENATAGEPPYKNFLAEIKLAQELNLPMLVFADPRIKLVGGSDEAWIRVPTNSKEIAPEGERQLGSLFHSWRNPREPHFIFLATDLDGPTAAFDRDVRRLIETITGMPTVVGPDLMTNNIQDAIMESISKAFLVIADISGDDNYRFNIDVSMEAAIARAQGRNLRLIARGEERRPPFMLRTAGQLRTYRNEAEYCGLMRQLAWPFRRRVLNAEFS